MYHDFFHPLNLSQFQLFGLCVESLRRLIHTMNCKVHIGYDLSIFPERNKLNSYFFDDNTLTDLAMNPEYHARNLMEYALFSAHRIYEEAKENKLTINVRHLIEAWTADLLGTTGSAYACFKLATSLQAGEAIQPSWHVIRSFQLEEQNKQLEDLAHIMEAAPPINVAIDEDLQPMILDYYNSKSPKTLKSIFEITAQLEISDYAMHLVLPDHPIGCDYLRKLALA